MQSASTVQATLITPLIYYVHLFILTYLLGIHFIVTENMAEVFRLLFFFNVLEKIEILCVTNQDQCLEMIRNNE